MRAATDTGEPWPAGRHGYYVMAVPDTNYHDVGCAGCDWTERVRGDLAAHDLGRQHVADNPPAGVGDASDCLPLYKTGGHGYSL